MRRKNGGFNIIELMVAIATSATIIATVVTSFNKLYAMFMYNSKYLAVNQELRIAMQIMKNDLNNAGVFGAFSFHNQTANNFESIANNLIVPCANNGSCSFDVTTIGVKSFESRDTSSVPSFPNTYKVSSDILKVQFGNDKPAELQAKDNSACLSGSANQCIISYCNNVAYSNKYYLGQLSFAATNSDLNPNAPMMILSSSNHAYLLQNASLSGSILDNSTPPYILRFADNDGCPKPNSYPIKAVPVSKLATGKVLRYDSLDPDIHTMSLANLYTSYYFVATNSATNESGLFVMRQNPVTLALDQPELISSTVKKMTIEYVLDNNMNFNHTQNAKLGRFSVCSTTQMSSYGEIRCRGKWNRIVAVNISLSAAGYSTNLTADQFDQEFTDTVGWVS